MDGKVAYESILNRKEPLLAIRGCCEEVELVTLKHNSRGMYETKSLIVNDIRAVRHPNIWDDVTVRRSDWDVDTTTSEEPEEDEAVTVFNRQARVVVNDLEPECDPIRFDDMLDAMHSIIQVFNIYHYGYDDCSGAHKAGFVGRRMDRFSSYSDRRFMWDTFQPIAGIDYIHYNDRPIRQRFQNERGQLFVRNRDMYVEKLERERDAAMRELAELDGVSTNEHGCCNACSDLMNCTEVKNYHTCEHKCCIKSFTDWTDCTYCGAAPQRRYDSVSAYPWTAGS